MPRPTAAQLSYGSVTVVFSTLAMLLLFRTSSGIGIAAVSTTALVLGLVVSVTVPTKPRRHTARVARTSTPVSSHHATAPAARTGGRAPVSAQSRR
ncbi:hypothetical protein [Streptomyces sp. NPDC047803]|uniref:hypothetical protein n=1 Tax=Streptomyces TaxID=1883 RepID=UPI0033E9ADFA